MELNEPVVLTGITLYEHTNAYQKCYTSISTWFCSPSRCASYYSNCLKTVVVKGKSKPLRRQAFNGNSTSHDISRDHMRLSNNRQQDTHPLKDFLYWKPCSRATRQQLTANNQL